MDEQKTTVEHYWCVECGKTWEHAAVRKISSDMLDIRPLEEWIRWQECTEHLENGKQRPLEDGSYAPPRET